MFKTRQVSLPREIPCTTLKGTLHSSRDARMKVMWCWEADESVVVIKSQPMKAGNSLEGKTGMTLCVIIVTPSSREEAR